MRVLNVPVSPELLASWRSFLAPQRQPFFLCEGEMSGLRTVPRAEAGLTPEERDTYTAWRIPRDVNRVAWLNEANWDALPVGTKRELLRLQVKYKRGNVPSRRDFIDLLPDLPTERFLWKPEHLTPEVLCRAVGVIQKRAQPCQRDNVPVHVWDGAQALLPGARELAGTFPVGSAGNCFGTVMGAAGIAGAAQQWVQRDTFEAFLAQRARPGGQDDRPRTLLVWRNTQGEVEHAAVTLGGGTLGGVTLGGGFALQKPSQTWWTPRVVQPVRGLIRAWRTPGQRLKRYTLL